MPRFFESSRWLRLGFSAMILKSLCCSSSVKIWDEVGAFQTVCRHFLTTEHSFAGSVTCWLERSKRLTQWLRSTIEQRKRFRRSGKDISMFASLVRGHMLQWDCWNKRPPLSGFYRKTKLKGTGNCTTTGNLPVQKAQFLLRRGWLGYPVVGGRPAANLTGD